MSLFVLRVQYLPFVTPEDTPQYIPAPILTPTFPNLTPYELFGDLSGIQSGQEIETALNFFPPPYCDPAFSLPIVSPVNDAASPDTIYPVPIPPSPPTPTPSQNTTGCPSNWRKIPQTDYGWGKKQWNHQPSEPILFYVNGRPGVNMGDALRNAFIGFDGRDDLMFRDAGVSFSCRLLVRSLCQPPPPVRIDGPVNSSRDTHSTVNPR